MSFIENFTEGRTSDARRKAGARLTEMRRHADTMQTASLRVGEIVSAMRGVKVELDAFIALLPFLTPSAEDNANLTAAHRAYRLLVAQASRDLLLTMPLIEPHGQVIPADLDALTNTQLAAVDTAIDQTYPQGDVAVPQGVRDRAAALSAALTTIIGV